MPATTASHFKGVVGLLLALPCSFSASVVAAAGADYGYASLSQALSAQHAMQGWRDYAHASLVPDFDWADIPQAQAPNLLSMAFGAPERSRYSIGNSRLGVSIEHSRSSLRDLGRSQGGAFAPLQLAELSPVGVRQEIFSPGVVTETRFGQFEVGAVFAYQRFASWDLGSFSASEVGMGVLADRGGRTESSFGQGVRVGLTGQMTPKLSYELGYRSKVDMDAFTTYRGVYSAPGKFDLPAQLSARFGYRLGDTTSLAFGVEQIQYSQLTPFLSPSLPNRFLALLGDGSSPQFRWRDLTVYSLEWSWTPTLSDAFALRYSTRQQPAPVSSALRRALAQNYTHHNYALAYVRRLTPALQLGFSTSYAPSSYFLGYADPFLRGFSDGEQIEAELLLTALF